MSSIFGKDIKLMIRPGIYCPTVTFFDPKTEDLDIPNIRAHAVRLAKAGLAGVVTMGSNGEAVHLNREEKQIVTRETRSALDEAGFKDFPIIVGASEQSVRGTIELCHEAAEAGGDYALIIPPSYYRAAINNNVITEYYKEVADKSPLPCLCYNYPGAVAGIDMDSDLLINLAKHPNIVGTKFTCANTGKLARVALGTDALTHASTKKEGYMAFGGFSDFIVPALAAGSSGVIGGGANLAPKCCVKVFNLYAKGDLEGARKMQAIVSKGDWILTKNAIAGTKSALQSYFGYGGIPRRPLKTLTDDEVTEIKKEIKEMMDAENSL